MGIFTMTWVFEAGIIPTYIVYSQFGFIDDNPLVMICARCVIPST